MATEASIHAEPREAKLRAWFAPVLANGTRWCAPNLDTQCAFLRVGEWELPLTINDAQWDNSWVCSPFTHYVSYAQEEIRSAVPFWLATPANLVLRAVGRWLRSVDFNRVVMVNNWLMSTNPWPAWDGEGMHEALHAIRARWPEHAVVFRSLNDKADQPLLHALSSVGARIIPSRQVWWFAPDSKAVRHARALKKDVHLLRRADLNVVEHERLTEVDFARMTALYHELYLGKYSRHNPAYTEEFLRHLWRENLLRFTALQEPEGEFVGVEARGVLHGTMVSPVVGYALSRPQELGLYRRLAAIPVLAAREEGLPLNLSAGVGPFKAMRGGQPCMEYIAVVEDHLPWRRRAPWWVIEGLSRAVLAPIVRWRGL